MIGQALTLSKIRKCYGTMTAVHETDLRVEGGEFVSIVGPSGSGKTSLLTLIAGFEPPNSGTIHIGERDITALPAYRRDIGMVFQKYALFPHLTVRQNIAFPLRMRRNLSKSESAARVEAMLDLVRLPEFADRYPAQLSGGQQQRVAVARALVSDPPVILMDEPLGALDKKLRETMQIEIKRIQERLGATVVYVTHDQDEALTMSDRVAVMHAGVLQQVGTPAELYRQPASAFVADFIGAMNFVPGICLGSIDGQRHIRISERIVLKTNVDCREPVAYGGAVSIAIRPEHIKLASQTGGGPQALTATIDASIFVGPTQILLVRLTALPDIVLRVQLPVDQMGGRERGDTVSVTIDETMLRTFPAAERLAA